MDLSSLLTLLLVSFVSLSEAIKCKCTKESDTVKCVDGVCEGEACLMLDHPVIGIHFTCHTRTLQDGSCRTKTSKSNHAVRICGCHSQDFCNFSIWPNGAASEVSRPKSEETDQVNGVSSCLLLSISLIVSLRFL